MGRSWPAATQVWFGGAPRCPWPRAIGRTGPPSPPRPSLTLVMHALHPRHVLHAPRDDRRHGVSKFVILDACLVRISASLGWSVRVRGRGRLRVPCRESPVPPEAVIQT